MLRISRVSLADQVAESLVELIVQRGLREGESLPSAQELEREFGVSKTVIREALANLAARGLVRSSQGRDTVVVIPGGEQLRDLIEFRVRHSKIDLLAVQELREGLEVHSAQLAANRRTDQQLLTLRNCLDALENAQSDATFIQADYAFHQALAEASNNPLIPIVLDALSPLLFESRERTVAEWRAREVTLEPAVENHRRIFQAVDDRDAQAARTAMETDLTETRLFLARSLGIPADVDS
jgi:DNA-binding FadR family transcriptional regulator